LKIATSCPCGQVRSDYSRKQKMNRMNYKSTLALSCITLGLLSACSTATRQAPVIERTPLPVAVAEPVKPVEVAKVDAPGMYTVKKNDTLIRIALDHGQNYRDLVTWNSLGNPNDIKVDQVLRVLPPEPGSGTQTSAVSMPPSSTDKPPVLAMAKKTTPRADKKPFSEANLAELQKNEDKPGLGATPPVTPAPVIAAVSIPPSPVLVPSPSLTLPGDEKLSWAWPSDGKVVGSFDEGKNKGIDIAGKSGQHVMAAGAGKVMYAGSSIRGYGNLVIVKHNNSLLSAYAHNRNIVVKEGQTVSMGEKIAEMGDSDADSVKLHFEIRLQGKPVDPSKYLPSR
jgi:lipoprotein NlpD